MSALRDQLGAAVEVDALRLDGDSFADARFGSVRGRIARRRAARSAGIGGASVLGVGAVAVGSAQVPWANFVYGAAPGGQPTVVCTTTAPEAVATGDEFTIDIVEVVDPSASRAPESETSPDGVTKSNDGEAAGVSWMIVDAEGETIAKVAYDGTTLTVDYVDGNVSTIEPSGSAPTTVALPDGSEVTLGLDGTLHVNGVAGSSPAASPTPTVTCVTTTPEPSESASPEPSASPTVSISAGPSSSPDPAVSASPAAGLSPFQCGTVLEEPDHVGTEVSIGDITWLPAPEAEDAIRAYYEGAEESVQLDLSGEDVPVAMLQFARSALPQGASSWDLGDPANGGYGTISGNGVDPDSGAVVGAQFVLTSGGEIVATGLPFGQDAKAQELLVNGLESGNVAAEIYLLNATAGLAPCEGVTEAQLADAQLVAVAGIKFRVDGAESGPFYAWKSVPHQP